MQTLYIGYPALETFVANIDKSAPVYAMSLNEPGETGQHGYRTDRLTIVCQQPDTTNRVHYCRILVGRLSFINGNQPFDPDAQARKAHAETAWHLIKAWLEEQKITLIEATLATPLEHCFLDGTANFLAFSKDKGFYRDDDLLRHAALEIGSSR